MFKRIIFLVILLCLTFLKVYASPLRILVDGSGSMKGFFSTNGVEELVRQIENASKSYQFEVNSTVFISNKDSSEIIFQNLWTWLKENPSKRYGNITKLDELVGNFSKNEAIIIITDNFQDNEGEGIGRTQLFYRRLQDTALSRVYSAPVLLEFDGRVEVGVGIGIPEGKENAHKIYESALAYTSKHFIGKDGKIGTPVWYSPTNQQGLWKIPYKGLRGLAVYLLLTESDDEIEYKFKNFVEFIGQKTNTSPLLIRPLGSDAVKLKATESGQPDPKALECAGIEINSLPKANLNFQVNDKGEYSLGLKPDVALRYNPRNPAQFVVAFDIISTQAHIQLHPGGECESSAKLIASPLKVEAARQDILLPGVQGRAYAQPAYLVTPLDSVGPRAVFLVIDLPPLVGPDVPDEVFAGQLSASLDFKIQVPPSAWRTAPNVQRRYFTPNPLDLARVFSPKDLVRVLAPPAIELSLPVHLRSEVINPAPRPQTPMDFPWWLLGLFGVGGLSTGLWRWLRPLGFYAPVRVNGQRGRAVRVGGVLKPIRGSKLNIGDGKHLIIERSMRHGSQINVFFNDQKLRMIKPGERLNLPDSESRLSYLTGIEQRNLKKDGQYDQY
ncbi:hypothetical protein KKB55_21085 [Myxococcota bacterium]|nr:hypothetical protein [Myxococcota bacterium]MBU1900243.1 hypothetical protein [Myxococcota bacterium]